MSAISLLLRGGPEDRRSRALPVLAYAVVTALALTVAGGAEFFFALRHRPDLAETGTFYASLASVAVALLTFAGTRLGTAQIVPPLWLGAVVVAVVIGTAGGAAVLGLRRVSITPLGVRTRQEAPPSRLLLAGVGLVALLALYALGRVLPMIGGLAVTIAVAVGMFAVGMALLSLIGPPVLALGARRRVRRADGPRSAERLLAARALLEDPRAAWRQVQGVALVSFVSVVVGVGLALMGGVDPSRPEDALLVRDLRTGVLLTIGLSYLTLAATVAVHAAAEVFDRRQLYVALDRLGMPRSTIEGSRTRSVLGPVVTVTVIGAAAGGVLTLPLAGFALLVDPVTVALVLVALLLGVLMVRLGILLTRPLVSEVLRTAEPVV